MIEETLDKNINLEWMGDSNYIEWIEMGIGKRDIKK